MMMMLMMLMMLAMMIFMCAGYCNLVVLLMRPPIVHDMAVHISAIHPLLVNIFATVVFSCDHKNRTL